MKNELISIIVPVYNLESYIERAVKSICQQTYSNLEIILVDDGSTDKSLKIMEKLAAEDTRIRVIHQSNKGVTSARLTGIQIAKGAWIGFVDGDDYIESYMYERLMKNAVEYNTDISHCGYQMVFSDRVDYYYNSGIVVEQDRYKGIKDLLEGKYIEPGLCNKLFSSTVINRALLSKKMDLSIKNNEDLLMNFYLFEQAEKSIYEDFCPYHYIVRKDSAATSSINENKLKDPGKVLKIISKEIEKNVNLKAVVDRRILAYLIRTATITCSTKEKVLISYKKEARMELRKNFVSVIKGAFPKKQKILTLWCVMCPYSYEIVHEIYLRLSGNGKKYKI